MPWFRWTAARSNMGHHALSIDRTATRSSQGHAVLSVTDKRCRRSLVILLRIGHVCSRLWLRYHKQVVMWKFIGSSRVSSALMLCIYVSPLDQQGCLLPRRILWLLSADLHVVVAGYLLPCGIV